MLRTFIALLLSTLAVAAAPVSVGTNFVQVVLTNAASLISAPTNIGKITTSGYYAPGDGGGGEFVWVPGDSTATNHGTVWPRTGAAGRWKLANTEPFSVLLFGAKANDDISDSPNFQKAVDISTDKPVLVTDGVFVLSNTVFRSSSGVSRYPGLKLSGNGKTRTFIDNRVANGPAFRIDGNTNSSAELSNFYMLNSELSGLTVFSSTRPVASRGIDLRAAWYVTIKNCIFTNLTSDGIRFVNDAPLDDAGSCQFVLIENNEFINNDGWGIESLVNATNVAFGGMVVKGNYFVQNKKGGIHSQGVDVRIENNTLAWNLVGLVITNNASSQLKRNIIEQNEFETNTNGHLVAEQLLLGAVSINGFNSSADANGVAIPTNSITFGSSGSAYYVDSVPVYGNLFRIDGSNHLAIDLRENTRWINVRDNRWQGTPVKLQNVGEDNFFNDHGTNLFTTYRFNGELRSHMPTIGNAFLSSRYGADTFVRMGIFPDGSMYFYDGVNALPENIIGPAGNQRFNVNYGLRVGTLLTVGALADAEEAIDVYGNAKLRSGTLYMDAAETRMLKFVNGTPEGALAAAMGSLAVDTNSGGFYQKTSGTGNTGWIVNSPLSGIVTQGGSGNLNTFTSMTAIASIAAQEINTDQGFYVNFVTAGSVSRALLSSVAIGAGTYDIVVGDNTGIFRDIYLRTSAEQNGLVLKGNSGWVGLRTASPTNTLDVNGHTSLRSNLWAFNLGSNGTVVSLLGRDVDSKIVETAVSIGGSDGGINTNAGTGFNNTFTNTTLRGITTVLTNSAGVVALAINTNNARTTLDVVGGVTINPTYEGSSSDPPIIPVVIDANVPGWVQSNRILDARTNGLSVFSVTHEGKTYQRGLSVGVGTNIVVLTNMLYASATLDFPSTLAQTDSDLAITVAGAKTGDLVIVGAPIPLTGSIFSGFTSNDTVFVRYSVYGLAAKDPASATFKVKVEQFQLP